MLTPFHVSNKHQANRLRCTLDVCISHFDAGSGNLDLISVGEDVIEGCPEEHCQVKTSVTFSSSSSFLSLPVQQDTFSYFKLQMDFQTRYSGHVYVCQLIQKVFFFFFALKSTSDCLLTVMDSETSLTIYLTNGRVAATFKPSNNLLPTVTTETSKKYNDSLSHKLRVVFDEGRLSLIVDGAEKKSVESKRKCLRLFFFY